MEVKITEPIDGSFFVDYDNERGHDYDTDNDSDVEPMDDDGNKSKKNKPWTSYQVGKLISKSKVFEDFWKIETKKWQTESPGPDFYKLKHQQALGRFLGPRTPFNCLLAFHEVGTGKTCTAISIAEAAKMSTRFKRCYVFTRSKNVLNNFVEQMVNSCSKRLNEQFNATKKQRTGSASANAARITLMKRIISDFYTVINVDALVKTLKKSYTDDKKLEEKFSNCIFIVDEAHNLRPPPGSLKKKRKADQAQEEEEEEPETYDTIYEQIVRLFNIPNGCKKILLTGTPMRDGVGELALLLNLMIRDPKNRFDPKTFFSTYVTPIIDRKENEDPKVREFAEITAGMISYLKPPEERDTDKNDTGDDNDQGKDQGKSAGGLKFQTLASPHDAPGSPMPPSRPEFNFLKVLQLPMKGFQLETYQKATEDFTTKPNVSASGSGTEEPSVSTNFYVNQIQASVLALEPNTGASVVSGKPPHWKDTKARDKFIRGLRQAVSESNTASANGMSLVFDYLSTKSNKYAFVLDKVLKDPTRKRVVFCSYVGAGGIQMLGKILTITGAATELPNSIVGEEMLTSSYDLDKNPQMAKARYITLTGKDNDAEITRKLALYNCDANARGQYVSTILCSKVIGEGLVFKAVRDFVCLTPTWNMSALVQYLGRVYRIGSHAQLPRDEGPFSVNVYLVVSVDESKRESEDLRQYSIDSYIYEICEKKDKEIKAAERLCMITALDCFPFKARNVRQKAEDGSRACEYLTCEYTCASEIPEAQQARRDIYDNDIFIPELKQLDPMDYLKREVDEAVRIENKTLAGYPSEGAPDQDLNTVANTDEDDATKAFRKVVEFIANRPENMTCLEDVCKAVYPLEEREVYECLDKAMRGPVPIVSLQGIARFIVAVTDADVILLAPCTSVIGSINSRGKAKDRDKKTRTGSNQLILESLINESSCYFQTTVPENFRPMENEFNHYDEVLGRILKLSENDLKRTKYTPRELLTENVRGFETLDKSDEFKLLLNLIYWCRKHGVKGDLPTNPTLPIGVKNFFEYASAYYKDIGIGWIVYDITDFYEPHSRLKKTFMTASGNRIVDTLTPWTENCLYLPKDPHDDFTVENTQEDDKKWRDMYETTGWLPLKASRSVYLRVSNKEMEVKRRLYASRIERFGIYNPQSEIFCIKSTVETPEETRRRKEEALAFRTRAEHLMYESGVGVGEFQEGTQFELKENETGLFKDDILFQSIVRNPGTDQATDQTEYDTEEEEELEDEYEEEEPGQGKSKARGPGISLTSQIKRRRSGRKCVSMARSSLLQFLVTEIKVSSIEYYNLVQKEDSEEDSEEDQGPKRKRPREGEYDVTKHELLLDLYYPNRTVATAVGAGNMSKLYVGKKEKTNSQVLPIISKQNNKKVGDVHAWIHAMMRDTKTYSYKDNAETLKRYCFWSISSGPNKKTLPDLCEFLKEYFKSKDLYIIDRSCGSVFAKRKGN